MKRRGVNREKKKKGIERRDDKGCRGVEATRRQLVRCFHTWAFCEFCKFGDIFEALSCPCGPENWFYLEIHVVMFFII